MQLSDLLIAAHLITEEELGRAMALHAQRGGRPGDSILAALPEKAEALRRFFDNLPPEPRDVAETGIDETELLSLLIKLIYTGRLESPRNSPTPSSCRPIRR